MAIKDINITAENLNTSYDALGKRFDNYFSQISISAKNSIQKALSDWQDFYYAAENYGNWPSVDNWIDVYNKSETLLNESIKKKNLKPKKPVEAKPLKKIVIEAPTVVYGRNQSNWKILFSLLGAGIGLGSGLAWIGKRMRKG